MLTLENKLNVDPVIEELEKCPSHLWDEVKGWQTGDVDKTNIGAYSKKVGKSVIREQERIMLIWFVDKDGKPWYSHENYRTFPTELKKNAEYFPNTVELLTQYFLQQNKKIIRLYFSGLKPGNQIYPHRDEPFVPENNNFESVQRYGIVITTNQDCRFRLQDIELHIPQGVIYRLDNMLVHAATNFGTSDRYHMYMDVIPIN